MGSYTHHLFLPFFFLFTIIAITAAGESSNGLKQPAGKMTHLHFYLHQTLSGPSANVVRVASLNKTSTFGDITVYDNPLTEGPEPTSKLVGKAQGTNAQASQEAPAVLTVLNFVFTEGAYNGSTLAIMGWHPLLNQEWEFAVVGGSGQFRLARGYTLVQLLTANSTYIAADFNVYVQR